MSWATLPVLLVVVAAASARPPTAPGFLRHDRLQFRLAERLQELKDAEAFQAKPRQEKIVILFGKWKEGAPNYFGKDRDKVKLVGEDVVKELLKGWEAVQMPADQCDPDHLRILYLLPEAMAKRYGRTLDMSSSLKRERYEASQELVKALTSDYYQIRFTAIECLKGIYRNEGRFYRPEAPPKDRASKAKAWKTYILKEYRGR